MSETHPLIRLARHAQVDADFPALGRLVNRTKTPTERGSILGMLACEIALRKKNLPLALRVLRMARNCFPDDYVNLKSCLDQEKLIRRSMYDEDYVQRVIQGRAELLRQGKL